MGTIYLISIFYLKMPLTSPIFPSTQIVLPISLQISKNLTTFSFMMELTLSSVSHTKMKLQFHVLIYTLSIVTEEKSEFPGHDAFHPEFCKALFFPNSTAGCKCVYLCLIACFHAQTVIWYARPLPCCHQHAFLGIAEKQIYVGHRLSLWNSQKTLGELRAFGSAPQRACSCSRSHKVPPATKSTAWVRWLLVLRYHLSAQQQDPV